MISISKKYAVVLFVLLLGGNCWAAGSSDELNHAIKIKLDELSQDSYWRFNEETGLFHSTRNSKWNETPFSLLLKSASEADIASLAFVLASRRVNINNADQYGNFALKMALDGDKQSQRKQRDYAQRQIECVVLLLQCGANADLICQGMLKKMQNPAVGFCGVARDLIGYAQVRNCMKYAECADDDCDDNFPDDAVVITEPTAEERFAALEATLRDE